VVPGKAKRRFHFAYFDQRSTVGSAIEVVQYDRQSFEMIEDLKGPQGQAVQRMQPRTQGRTADGTSDIRQPSV